MEPRIIAHYQCGALPLLVFLVLVSSLVQDASATFLPLDVSLKFFTNYKEYAANVSGRIAAVKSQEYHAQLPIDHTNSRAGTFTNRWWMNDTYYEGGPVFFYDSGESNADWSVDQDIMEKFGPTAAVQLAKAYKGLVIYWEHRYYGASQPFNFTKDVPPTSEQLSYLTFEQALEDVVYFAKNFDAPKNSDLGRKLNRTSSLRSNETPWVFLGGSYPGMRAAALRIRNPDVIFASWASSAPVQAQVEMPSYFQTIQRGLPKNCSADYIAATKYIDDALSGSNATLAAEVKYQLVKARLMDAEGETPESLALTVQDAASFNNGDVASVMLLWLYYYQSSGLKYIAPGVCEVLETRIGTISPTDSGLASTFGVEVAYHAFLDAIGYLDTDVGLSLPTGPELIPLGAWPYQVCSEFGFYQDTNAGDPNNIVTRFVDRNFYDEACRKMFPEGSIPSSGPAIENINKYGGWFMNPSRTLFTNGELDPWRTLSVASEESNAPKRTAYITVPRCDGVHDEKSYFGVVYPGQTHVSDFSITENTDRGNSASFRQGLALFKEALDQWLPCFKANASHAGPTSTMPSASSPTGGGASDAVDLQPGRMLLGGAWVLTIALSLL